MKSIKNIAVLTSGGDAPGMNAAIRAVVRTASFHNIKVFGIMRGYDGMINGDFKQLLTYDVANIIQRGGTILKSARSTEFHNVKGRLKAIAQLHKYEIDGIIAIGGNGTYTGAMLLAEESGIPIIGLPGTIDNDINGTDITIGCDTAMNNAIEAIDKIRDTADAHERVFFVEVMGRDEGYIGLNVGLAIGAEATLIPEIHHDLDHLNEFLERHNNRKKLFSIIIVAEGNTEGNAFQLAEMAKKSHPNLDIKVTILGHIQRGGSPSAIDRINASKWGYYAVLALMEGKKNIAMGYKNGKLSETPFSEAVLAKAKNMLQEIYQITKVLSI